MKDQLFFPDEAQVYAQSLNFITNSADYASSGMTYPIEVADAALDHFNAMPFGPAAHPIDPQYAPVGLQGVERALVLLDDDPELGILIGPEPKVRAAMEKLRRYVRGLDAV